MLTCVSGIQTMQLWKGVLAVLRYKLLYLLFCIGLLTAMLVSCSDKEGTEGLEYFLLSDDTYGVSAGDALYKEEIVIPATHKGKPVTQIVQEGFKDADNLTKITIPPSINRIATNAFEKCPELEDIYITDVKAWMDISYGGSKSRPNSFGNVHVMDKNGNEITRLEIPAGTTSIEAKTFQNFSVTSVVIPEGVTAIGNEAFASCEELTDVELPQSVTSIANSAFSHCEGLVSIDFSGNENLTHMGINVFYGCTNLETVVLPATLERGDSLFFDCNSLKTVTVPAAVAGDAMLSSSSSANLTLILIGEGDSMNFRWIVQSLTSVIVKGSFQEMEQHSFSRQTKLADVVLSEGVETIRYGCFGGCTALERIVIPKSVTTIEDDAFLDCDALNAVYYGGTEAEWELINGAKDVPSELERAPRYYYSASEPTTEGNYWRWVNDVPTPW